MRRKDQNSIDAALKNAFIQELDEAQRFLGENPEIPVSLLSSSERMFKRLSPLLQAAAVAAVLFISLQGFQSERQNPSALSLRCTELSRDEQVREWIDFGMTEGLNFMVEALEQED